MQVEICGTGNLGIKRRYFSTIHLLNTALGPLAFGYFIDRNYSFITIMLLFGGISLVIITLSFKLSKVLTNRSESSKIHDYLSRTSFLNFMHKGVIIILQIIQLLRKLIKN